MQSLAFHIKDRLPALWIPIEKVNGFVFSALFRKRVHRNLNQLLDETTFPDYEIRQLNLADIEDLQQLVSDLEPEYRPFFEPHAFDLQSLKRVFQSPSYFPLGFFLDGQLIGYFFLRCFFNKRCFVGRVVAKDHRSKGIGKTMNHILYHTAWNSGFRCFATFSPENQLVMLAHSHNPAMHIRKTLPSGYILAEFIQTENIK